MLTEYGSEKVEEMLEEGGHLAEDSAGLYDPANISVVHHVNQALRANVLYLLDRDYIVRDGEVMLIDEFTGRMMHGRRLSEGLHQAIEAKEKVEIQPENQTLASVTIQNYFRLYKKLSGMTGTAATEAPEFHDIYKMDVTEIPTNRPVARIDDDDEVYRTAAEKNQAIIAQIEDCYRRGQPILVGTVSIEKSEHLSELLKAHKFEIDGKKQTGIPHNVLNARYHEQEAFIVADAGVPGVGDHRHQHGRPRHRHPARRQHRHEGRPLAPGAARPRHRADARGDAGRRRPSSRPRSPSASRRRWPPAACIVLGTERHESRRIDNQLRGRTGRQGDPGHSKFFLSCEDDLLRIFAGERLDSIMRTFGVAEGEAITHRWLNSAIATAQKKVEARNFDIRKNLLKYDDVVNDQRKAVFEQRQEFMEADGPVGDRRRDAPRHRRRPGRSATCRPRPMPTSGTSRAWTSGCRSSSAWSCRSRDWAAEEGIANEEIEQRINAAADARAAEREAMIGAEQMRGIEKNFLLQMVDLQWREHLMHLDHLRNVIGLRGYGQRDPLNEYKTEAFSLFEKLLVDLRQNVTRWVMTVEFRFEEPAAARCRRSATSSRCT